MGIPRNQPTSKMEWGPTCRKTPRQKWKWIPLDPAGDGEARNGTDAVKGRNKKTGHTTDPLELPSER